MHTISFILRCGGKEVTEDRERSNPTWPPVHRVYCSNAMVLGTKQCRNTFKVLFPTTFGDALSFGDTFEIARIHGHAISQGQVKVRSKLTKKEVKVTNSVGCTKYISNIISFKQRYTKSFNKYIST